MRGRDTRPIHRARRRARARAIVLAGGLAGVGTLGLLGCRPPTVPAPPSALSTDPEGPPVASVTRVDWPAPAEGTPTVDVTVPLVEHEDLDGWYQRDAVIEHAALGYEAGSHRMTVGSPSRWLGEGGALIDQWGASWATAAPPDGRWRLRSRAYDHEIASAEIHPVRDGAVLLVSPPRRGHAETTRHGHSRFVGLHHVRPDGSFELTRAVGSIFYDTTARIVDDGIVVSSSRSLAAPTPRDDAAPPPASPPRFGREDWVPGTLAPGTHRVQVDGTITRLSDRVFEALAVDGERVWGVERRAFGARVLVGMDRGGGVFFSERLGRRPRVPRPFADMVCVEPPGGDAAQRDAARACFGLDGRPVDPAQRPRAHLIEAADGWRVLQTEEALLVYDAQGRLAWQQALPPRSSPAVLTEAGRVCVLTTRGPDARGRRLQCWGGVAP